MESFAAHCKVEENWTAALPKMGNHNRIAVPFWYRLGSKIPRMTAKKHESMRWLARPELRTKMQVISRKCLKVLELPSLAENPCVAGSIPALTTYFQP
jgi:hypothetical protein